MRLIQICFDYFVGILFSLVSKNKSSKMNFTKIVKADLDSPCRELSNGGLGIVVALLAPSGSLIN